MFSFTGDRIPEYYVFGSNYHDLITLLSNANLYGHFVSKDIITVEDHQNIFSISNARDKAVTLLKPISAALKTGYPSSFYDMLDIMKTHGNQSVRAFAEKITQSDALTGTESGT